MLVFFDTMLIRSPENTVCGTLDELLPAAKISKEMAAVVLSGEMTCGGRLLPGAVVLAMN